jgi:hypothetical protein
MPVDTHWLTEGTTREPCRLTWGTRTSSIRFATLSCRRHASRTFGANENLAVSVPQAHGYPFDDSAKFGSAKVRLFEVASAKQVDDGRGSASLI